jgi:glycosyltransferase involved in cell wall biosynthesis
MLSVIIATFDSERALVPTLAALVPGATAGLISEVIIADGGSSDETAAVADVAGCDFLPGTGPLGRRLKAATVKARAPWLMFLRPGTILDAPWTADVDRLVQQPATASVAAVFQRGAPAQSGLGDALSLLATALGARPRPEQGLIIPQALYKSVGGHADNAADPESELLRRIGRRRIVTLSTRAFQAAAPATP